MGGWGGTDKRVKCDEMQQAKLYFSEILGKILEEELNFLLFRAGG